MNMRLFSTSLPAILEGIYDFCAANPDILACGLMAMNVLIEVWRHPPPANFIMDGHVLAEMEERAARPHPA